MTGPIEALETGIKSKLNISAITDLLNAGEDSIFSLLAPPDAKLPFIVFQHQGGGDNNWTPVRNRTPVYTIKALARTKAEALAIDKQVDLAFHNQTLTVSGWSNYATEREEDFQLVETDEAGKAIWQIGGMYRLRISK